MKAGQSNLVQDPITQTEMENIYHVLNNISLGNTLNGKAENLDWQLIEATANATAPEDTVITHALGRVPIGSIVLSKSASGDYYAGSGTNTDTLFYLRFVTANTRFLVAIV